MKRLIIITLLILFMQGISYKVCTQNVDPCEPHKTQKPPEEYFSQPGPGFVDSVYLPVVNPVDPNEIIGSDSYDAIGSTDKFLWVSGTQTSAHAVYFKNNAEFDTVMASKVNVKPLTVSNIKKIISANTGINVSFYC